MELKRSYEVSIWSLQDEFITVLKPLNVENIGQLENKELQLKTDDGVNQYSCSIPMYIYRNGQRIENPIWYNTLNGNIVSNLRKIKVIINKGADSEEIYEFLITKVEERHDKDQLYCDITCEDLAFHELGKRGYKISLSTDVFLDKYNKWADGEDDFDSEPHSTLQYWLEDKDCLNLKPVPEENPLATEWYYEIQMNWDAYADGSLRDTDKVYEEEYSSSWTLENDTLIPAAIEEYKEKERLVDLEESNIFNLTQNLAETFGVFVKYKYLYDDNYHIRGRRIIFYNNYIREEEGYIDVSYPYDASQITRTIDATDVTTKMYVRPIAEDSSESGMLSITNVDANKTREDYLLNFDYLYAIGAITKEQYEEIPKYEAHIYINNIQLENLKSCIDALDTELADLEATRTILLNSIQLDQERIQEATDLLNSLDMKDLDIDGAITIGENKPGTAVLLAQTEETYEERWYINISEPGVLRDTLHIYANYEYVGANAGLSNELTGTYVDDEFGNLIQVKDIIKPANMRSSLVYLTYKYVPSLKYEQVERIWSIRLQMDQNKLSEVTQAIEDKEEEYEELQSDYDDLLEEKSARVEAFNNMMGPALRESYWQPEDYKANGDNFTDTFNVTLSSVGSILGQSNHATFLWDEEAFKEEQLAFYNITVLEQPIYYPCIDLSGHWDYIIENYDQLSFMFYDYIAGVSNPYQIKYFKHFSLGSQAQLGFVKYANGSGYIIKPVLILTGAESISLMTLRNMINEKSTPASQGPLIGIYSTAVVNNEVVGSIDANAFPITWLNLQNIQVYNSQSYDLTDAAEFNAWAQAKFAAVSNNIEIAAMAEKDVWGSFTLVYPRIKIDSMLLKNDESLSLHNGNNLLNNFEDYYLLTRQVSIGASYKGMYFLTIKPEALKLNTNNIAALKFYFSLSNAQTAIYLDAIQVLKENAYPKVTYTITPNLLRQNLHYTLHQLLNRIVNINDIDLKFVNVQGYISGLTLNLDNPFNDKIEIKNYRNKFEDLFSSIVAQTESMKKNAYTIGLMTASFTPTGALAPAVIQQSINQADLQYAFNQGTLTIDEENGIWATSDDGAVAIRGGGIFTATEQDGDGNWKWNTGILPSGINASLITTGQLDTNLIRIYAGDKLKFQMNGDGLYAYKSIFDDSTVLNLMANNAFKEPSEATRIINQIDSHTGLDLKQYVVHNAEGLFLVAESGAIVKVKDNNVDKLDELNNTVTRVEISWDGLKLRNWSNEEVFYANPDTGDLTLKGTVYATGLYISGTGSANPPTIQEYVSSAITSAEITYSTQYYVTTSSTTPTGSEAGWTTTPVTSLAANEYLWTRRGTTQNGNTTYSNPTLLRTPSSFTALVTLAADSQFFTKALDGTYSPGSITVTAQAQNCNITGWYIDNVLVPNSAGMTTYTLNAPVSGSEWLTKKIEVQTNITDITDVITFYILEEQSSGTTPSYVYLTNENMSFPANASGTTTAATSYNTTLIAQTGSSRVQPSIASIAGTTYNGSAITTNGITVTATYDSTNVQYNITVAAANNSTLGGTISGSIPIVISAPVAQTLYINWTKSMQGISGTSPVVYELDVSDSSISTNGSTLQPSTLVLSAVKHEGNTQTAVTSGVCYYYATSTDGTSYGTATKITTPSSFSTSGLSSAKLVRFYLYSGSDNTGTLYDWQTVPIVAEGANGTDAYTVILSNENHTFPGTVTTAITSSTTCAISVYEGMTAKSFTVNVNSITKPAGMTITESGGVLTISVASNLNPTSGSITIPIAITGTGLTINKTFTYNVSFKGANGDTGISIDTVADIYYLQTSGQSVPTQPTTSTTIVSTDTPDTWTTVVPTYQTGAQYWRCLKYVFSDNTVSFGAPYIDAGMTQAAADAAAALAVANSKNAIYYSNTEPSQYHRGDIWIDTSDEDGNQYMAMYDYDDASLPQERTERWVRINTKIEGTSMIVDTQNGLISIAAQHEVSISGGNLNLLSNGAINVGSGGSINIASDGHFQIASSNFNVTSNGDVSVTGAITATSLKIGNGNTIYTSVDSLVNDSTLNQYVTGKQGVLNTMTFEPSEGLVIRADNGSPYSTVTKSDGYFIKYEDTIVAGFTGTLTTINQLRIGNIAVKPTSSGGWKWIDAEDI